MPGSRREARERALGLLYEAEMRDQPVAEVLAELPLAPDPFAEAMARGVEATVDRVDELIRKYLRADWPFERLPVLDRTVLRMATWELLDRADVPTGVVISEAVELAKSYSTDDSGRFVNGVLASIAAEVRRPPHGEGSGDPEGNGSGATTPS